MKKKMAGENPEFEKNHPGAREMLEWIVRRLGGRIRNLNPFEEAENGSGSLVVNSDRTFTIFLSPYTSILRDNFTIAHELGHYFLHYKDEGEETVVFNRYGSDVFEWEANRFAAALLMPKEEFKQAVQVFNGNLSAVAGHFEVSVAAADVRNGYIHNV
ncbi:ImmA/IrrE family metallo-endopeptidase [Desulfomonile tiedjei]|uniref:ImmA/IrrE family metallo-endopeptidase n=1 Tax=Desulfomonile tiedjei TaxID=2358 RepID=UPI0012FCE811|nr:ImmA/IrrE family metallo-endopeptidase [Desulfomonile tiedjei]